jgi:hypothetical protein
VTLTFPTIAFGLLLTPQKKRAIDRNCPSLDYAKNNGLFAFRLIFRLFYGNFSQRLERIGVGRPFDGFDG